MCGLIERGPAGRIKGYFCSAVDEFSTAAARSNEGE